MCVVTNKVGNLGGLHRPHAHTQSYWELLHVRSYLTSVEHKLSASSQTFSNNHQVLERRATQSGNNKCIPYKAISCLPIVDNVLVLIGNKRVLISSLEYVYASLIDSQPEVLG